MKTTSQKIHNLQEFEDIMNILDKITDYQYVYFQMANYEEKPLSYPCIVIVIDFEHNDNFIQLVSIIYPFQYEFNTYL